MYSAPLREQNSQFSILNSQFSIPINLLHVITSLRQGGAERLLSQLLPRLRRAGIDTSIALLDGTPTPFFQPLLEAGIEIHSLGHNASNMYNPLCIPSLSRLMRGFDIVHTHNTPAQYFAALAPHSRRTRFVTTEHNTTNRRRGHAFMRPIDRWMYRRYDHIVCCSEPTRQALLNSCIASGQRPISQFSILNSQFPPVSTITNGIDLSPWQAVKPPVPPAPHGEINILMVAAFRPQKDHITPLRALQHLPENVTLTYAGEGETLPAIRKAASELGGASRVRFPGNVDDIPALYSTAHIALLSTHHEGLSLSVIEALASGRPLVCTAAPGVIETVSLNSCSASDQRPITHSILNSQFSTLNSSSALTFPDGDHRALAAHITSLINDPSLYTSLSNLGRAHAATFDISTTLQSHINLYNNLLCHVSSPSLP